MKSIMEEASSIVKAIEKGWITAGQPKEFTIKIFEEPQKNFIGMTVRPAKIGIFFTESALQKTADAQSKKRKGPAQERLKTEPVAQERSLKAKPARQKEAPKREQRIQEQPRPETSQAETEPKGPIWTDEMMETVKNWITEVLSYSGFGHIPFTVNAQHFHLKIQFEKGFFDDKNREKYLFASLSNLLLTMLKRQYKRPLKGYKIVLLGGA